MTDFDKVIPPGSEGKLNATVDIEHALGPIEKQILIETNDPERPRTHVQIKADVQSYVDVKPSDQLTFRISKGQPASKDLILTPAENKGIKLGTPSVNSDSIDLKMQPHEKNYALTVSLKPQIPVGSLRAVIKVPEENSPEKELTIPVFILVKGPISIAPPAVSFDVHDFPDSVTPRVAAHVRQTPMTSSAAVEIVKNGSALRVIAHNEDWYQVITATNQVGWVSKSVVKTVKAAANPEPVMVALQKTNGQDFKILDYSSELSQIKVEQVSDQGKSYTFKVSLLSVDRSRKGNVSGAILVKTDEPDQSSIRIPVYINVS